MIEVYCDGSSSPAVMIDPLNSYLGDKWITRGCVIIESLDLGLVAQDKGQFGDRLGCEAFAIQLAEDLRRSMGLRDVCIFNDNKGAVRSSGLPHVSWRPREETHLPNRFLEQIINRAAYVRQTRERASKRRGLEPHQREIFELFVGERSEFKLSASHLWSRLRANAEKWPRSYEKRRRSAQPSSE